MEYINIFSLIVATGKFGHRSPEIFLYILIVIVIALRVCVCVSAPQSSCGLVGGNSRPPLTAELYLVEEDVVLNALLY